MPRDPVTPTTFKRQGPGAYATGDGRFTIEQASGGWMLTDTEQVNELGMALVRGPYPTLAAAREAAEIVREGPAPTSDLAARIAALPPRPREAAPRAVEREELPAPEPTPAPEPPVEVREWQAADGPALRRLWDLLDLRSLGDDDAGLARMAARNPGLLLVATVGDEIIGSALGGWDGRRGWIYHVGTHPDHRHRGTAQRLVTAIEDGLRALGCPKVNVIVLDDNEDGVAFWLGRGYTLLPARQYGRVL